MDDRMPEDCMYAKADMTMDLGGPHVSNIHIGYDDQRDGFDESLTLEMARSLSRRLNGLLDQIDRMSKDGICEE